MLLGVVKSSPVNQRIVSLFLTLLLFVVSLAVIAVAGSYLTRTADKLADLSGWGEALFGAVFLGSITSLPGIITSVTTAYANHPQLAVSNAIGGIAAQTMFLAIADMAYRKANLEHASASLENLMQGVLLLGLLSTILIGVNGPAISLFHISPFSLLLLLMYAGGFRLISRAQNQPMWKPLITTHTVKDEPEKETLKNSSLPRMALRFGVLAVLVAVSGYGVAQAGIGLVEQTTLSEGFVGNVLTAVATSTPELVVSVAAIRQRALNLAVSNIIGGNTFDVLFVAFADMAYLEGSILQAVGQAQTFTIALTMLMTSVLILGLLVREKHGIARIGWESVLIVLLYLLGNLFVYFA